MNEIEEKIARELTEVADTFSSTLDFSWGQLSASERADFLGVVEKILKVETPEYRIATVKKKPELPENPIRGESGAYGAYEKAQSDMLAHKFVQEAEG